MTTTCPTCKREYNTIVSGVSCPFCAWRLLCLAAPRYQAGLDAQARGDYWLTEEATSRYNEAQWARSGTNYSDWYTGDRGR